MSCSGCRVLRKGCSDACILRPCLQWIESAEAQGHATVFVAKFFGRAGLMSFISSVPDHQRPALFQSLLFEACGRTVNPVNGAVGLLWTGNWHVCQTAVETVLRGGALQAISSLPALAAADVYLAEESGTKLGDLYARGKSSKGKAEDGACELDLSLGSRFSAKAGQPASPSEEESVITSVESSHLAGDRKVLNLFV